MKHAQDKDRNTTPYNNIANAINNKVLMLRKYDAERKAANPTMTAVMDGVQKLYKVDLGPLNVGRAAAFHAANYVPLLKRNIISFASCEQRLPPLFM